MEDGYIFTPEVIFYEDQDACGYKIHATTAAGKTFLILASPGSYATTDDARVASIEEIHRLRANMAQRDARLMYSGKCVNGAA